MQDGFLVKIGKLALLFVGMLLAAYFFVPAFGGKKTLVNIPAGTTSTQISQILQENKVIANSHFFSIIVRLLNYDTKLQAGVYEFTSPTFFSVADMLLHGKVKTYKITIPEGMPTWEIANLLAGKKVLHGKDFLKVVGNPEYFYEKYAWLQGKDTLEGYLFPDTYYFLHQENPIGVVDKFLKNFERTVIPLYENRYKENTLSLHELIVIASIIEKEAMVSSERPIIAGVFYNRLGIGMRLMADPTVNYALGNFYMKLNKEALVYNSPYNTYMYPGLPPGPICSPGLNSVKAALYPAEVDYLYFVAKQDGTHIFSRTYREHLQAIEKYQRENQEG